MIQDTPELDLDIEAIRAAQAPKKVRGGDEIDADIESMRVANTPVSPWTLGFRLLPDEDIETGYRDLMTLRGFREAATPEPADTPLLGPGFVVYDAAQITSAAGKMQTGRATVDDERIVWRAMIEQARTTTSGGTFAELAKSVVTSGAEVLAGAGVVGVGAIATRKAAQAGMKKLFSEWVEKQAQAAIEKRIGEVAVDTGIDLTTAAALKEGAKIAGKGAAVLGTATALQEAVPVAAGAEGGAWTAQAIKGVLGSEMTDEEAQKVADDWHAAIPMLVEKGGGLQDGMIRQSIQMFSEGFGGALGLLPVVKQVDMFFGALFKYAAGRGVTSASKLARAALFSKPGGEVAEEFLAATAEAAIMGDKSILDAALEVAEITPEMLAAFALPGGAVAGGVRLRDMAQRGGPRGVKVPAVGEPQPLATEGGGPDLVAPEVSAGGAAPVDEAEVEADVEAFREAVPGGRVEFARAEPQRAEEYATRTLLSRYNVRATFVDAPEGVDVESLPAAFYPGKGRAVIVRGSSGVMGAGVHEALHSWHQQQPEARRAEWEADLRAIDPKLMAEVEAFTRTNPLYKNAAPEVIAEEIRTNVGSFVGKLVGYLHTPQGKADFALVYENDQGPIRRTIARIYDWIQEQIKLLPQRKRALARARLRIGRAEGDPALVAQRVIDALAEIRPVAAEAGAAVPAVTPPSAAPGAQAPAAPTSVAPKPAKTPADRRANRAARKARAAERAKAIAAEKDAAEAARQRRMDRASRRGKPAVVEDTDEADDATAAQIEAAQLGLGRDQGMRFAARVPIDVDGTPRPRVNNEGQPLAPNDDSIRNFWRWYGQPGALLADDGTPVVLYHGTPGAAFNSFRASRDGAAGPGVYLALRRAKAAAFAGPGGDVLPVYARGAFQRVGDNDLVNARERAAAARTAGTDGVLIGAVGEVLVFDPAQIKSATGNAGTFDPANPDIRFAPRIPSTALRASFLDDGEILTLSDRALRGVSDEFLAPERWQRAAVALGATTKANPISAVRRFFGKVAVKAEPIKDFADRIGDHLRRSKISREDAGLYAEARHTREAREDFLRKHVERKRLAEERRALVKAAKDLPRDAQFERDLRALEKRIADLDFVPIQIPDGHTAEHYFHEVAGVTGMKTSEAEAWLAAHDLPGYKRLGRMIDALNRWTLRQQLDYQLITQAQYDSRRAQFQHYVPLRTAEVDKPERPRGSGFSVRGPETMRRKGRKSLASNPLVMSLAQAMKAVERGEKNAVGHELRDFLIENRAVLEHAERDVELNDKGEPALDSDEFYLKVAGRDVAIKIENPDVARAMKRLGLPQIPKALRVYASLFGYWKLAATSLSPEFMLTNFARDIETALVNVSSVARDLDLKGLRREMVRGVPSAGRTAWQGARGKPITTGLGDFFEEYRQAGGQIGSFGSAAFEAIEQSMESRMSDSALGKTRRALAPMWSVIQDANGAVEQANRFSLFVALRQRGVPVNDAALAARKITVDFSQKGEWGTALSLVYAFFSAAVGGTRRLAETMTSPTGRRIAGGLVGLGFAQTMANFYASDDDEDGQKFYAKISEGEKERTAIIMVPGFDEPLKVPIGYGLNVFYGAGRIAAETVLGMHTETEAAGRLLIMALNGFAPIGAAPSLAQFVSPTALDPAVQIIENQNFMGNPITPYESKFGPESPRYAKSFRTTSPLAVDMARVLNDLSGGDSVKPGALNVSGDEIEHLLEFAGAGVYRFGQRAAAATRAITAGESFSDVAQVAPFLRVVYGARTEFTDSDNFYKALDEIEYGKRYIREAEDAGDRDRARELRDRFRPILALEKSGDRVKDRAKGLRDEAYKDGSLVNPEKLREANSAMQAWFKDYLEALTTTGGTRAAR